MFVVSARTQIVVEETQLQHYFAAVDEKHHPRNTV